MTSLTESHRAAIESVAFRFAELGFGTAVNDGASDPWFVSIGELAFEPHVVVLEGDRPVRVLFVETGESLADPSVARRWKALSQCGIPFWIHVPAHFVSVAREEAARSRIPATVWPYEEEAAVCSQIQLQGSRS